VNTIPRTTVIARPLIVSTLLPANIALWDQVTVAPEDSKIAVFNKGTSKGFKGEIPTGGQTLPISTVGTKALWKKPQKKEMKNTTSVRMNSNIPSLRPL
jgi:hypothetical protein